MFGSSSSKREYGRLNMMDRTWNNKKKSLETTINDIDRGKLEKDIRNYCKTHEFIKARTIGLILCVNPNGVSHILKKMHREGLLYIHHRTRRMILYKKRRK